MKPKRKLKPLELIIVAAPLLMVGAALLPFASPPRWSRVMEGMPFFGRSVANGNRATCQSNLKQISLAVMIYAQDFNNKYPLVQSSGNRHGVGWADTLVPYHKTTQLYQCPTEGLGSSENPTLTDYTDYWFNSNLSGRNLADVLNPASTIASGDGNGGTDISDARYSKASPPANWLSDNNSPAWRHLTGANYAYADGHVKWVRPHVISNASARAGWPTFSIK